MLTCYDASFAALEDRCGVDVMLVGDSLGNVIQGKTSTLPVTMEHMVYHTACVAALPSRPMLVADMPFGAITSRRSRRSATPASCSPSVPRWSSSKAAR
jgi:3-methyl-2-oxobutanoate hydroxymethyltransferase